MRHGRQKNEKRRQKKEDKTGEGGQEKEDGIKETRDERREKGGIREGLVVESVLRNSLKCPPRHCPELYTMYNTPKPLCSVHPSGKILLPPPPAIT